MTLTELKARPDFVMLSTDQQRAFVVAYCTNGANGQAAAETAYAVNDKNSAVATANRNLRHPAIKRLVNDFYGQVDVTGTKDEFLAILWRKVNKEAGTDDKTQLGWATLYMKVKGYEAAKPAEEPPADEAVNWAAKVAAVKGE